MRLEKDTVEFDANGILILLFIFFLRIKFGFFLCRFYVINSHTLAFTRGALALQKEAIGLSSFQFRLGITQLFVKKVK
ncbi:MAG: hypothetical protein ACJAQ4_002545 [Cryomorphaceae bacterium]|jgi:hypothetical protein